MLAQAAITRFSSVHGPANDMEKTPIPLPQFDDLLRFDHPA